MNSALIRKDIRLLWPVTVGAIILAVVFYIMLPAVAVYDAFKQFDDPQHQGWTTWDKIRNSRFNLMAALTAACIVVNAVSLLWMAAIGGMAFAYERRERWADLLGTLPVTRWRLVGVKLASSVGWLVAYMAINASVFGVTAIVHYLLLLGRWDTSSYSAAPQTWQSIALKSYLESSLSFFCYGLAVFGVAWLVSAFVRSSAIAACVPIGLGAVLLTAFVFMNGQPLPTPNYPILQQMILEFGLPLLFAGVSIPAGIAVQRIRSTP